MHKNFKSYVKSIFRPIRRPVRDHSIRGHRKSFPDEINPPMSKKLRPTLKTKKYSIKTNRQMKYRVSKKTLHFCKVTSR